MKELIELLRNIDAAHDAGRVRAIQEAAARATAEWDEMQKRLKALEDALI